MIRFSASKHFILYGYAKLYSDNNNSITIGDCTLYIGKDDDLYVFCNNKPFWTIKWSSAYNYLISCDGAISEKQVEKVLDNLIELIEKQGFSEDYSGDYFN